MFAPETVIDRRLPASIEILPRQVTTRVQLTALLPLGMRVYLADIGNPGTEAEMLLAARHIRDAHLAGRRIRSRKALDMHIGVAGPAKFSTLINEDPGNAACMAPLRYL
jgi:hypothetical protein